MRPIWLRKALGRAAKVLGFAWLVSAALFAAVAVNATWQAHGMREALDSMNPLNPLNLIVNIVLFGPGMALWIVGHKWVEDAELDAILQKVAANSSPDTAD